VSHRADDSFDVLIANGRVVDGTGNPWFRADVGIRGDRIAAIGKLANASARLTLDAADKVVSPGFIDTHVHGDLAVLMDPLHEPAIRQGVTTYLVGQDGVAMAPSVGSVHEYMCRYTAGFSGGAEWLARPESARVKWASIDEYLTCVDRRSAVNVATLIPNGNVRMQVMGLETRAPTAREMSSMVGLIRDAMDQGAVGLSSGMDYIPSLYAQQEEMAELCRAIDPYGGVYVTHMRGYDPARVKGAMAEVFHVGHKGGVPVHISHFNSQATLVLPIVDSGIRSGLEVTYDLYCYLAGSSILAMVALPPWVQEGGPEPTLQRLRDPAVRKQLPVWFASRPRPIEEVRLSYVAAPEYRHLEGKTLGEAAGAANLADFLCELLLASNLAVGCIVAHVNRTENDLRALMNHPAMMAGSDGIYTGSHPHPRGTGCYARYLGKYVREGTWRLETAVARLAAHAAQRFGLRDRGLLREGQAADVVVFDPDKIDDRSTFDDGKPLAVGVEHVLVNGELVLHSGQRTPALPGRGLRRR
jgi:N-acyl-D-amino-acid deacylase